MSFVLLRSDEQASLRRKFLEKHKAVSESALGDYRALFMSIYGINIDWKEGTFAACLRHFQIIREKCHGQIRL